MSRVTGLVRALALASHPIPTVAVTAMTVGLAAGAGNGFATTLLVGVAVLSGQLSIGWSNDVIDSRRDRLVGRTDKPVAQGAVSTRTIAVAAFVGVVVTVPTSLALGPPAGLAQLVVVASGWVYNVALKSTLWSWTPFATAFGALPAVSTLVLPGNPWPAWWALAAGALVGVSAHLGNVLPDLAQDDATGVHGLPHQLGASMTAVVALVSALAAAVLVVFGPSGSPSPWAWLGLSAAVVVAVASFVVVRRQPSSEAAFYATMLVAAIGVVLLGASPRFP